MKPLSIYFFYFLIVTIFLVGCAEESGDDPTPQSSSLQGNRDFIISSFCDRTSSHYSSRLQAKSMDIDLVNDQLQLLEKVHDDRKPAYYLTNVPIASRIKVDSLNNKDNDFGWYDSSIAHHDAFKRHISENLLLTCNYSDGYAKLIFPIKNRVEWKVARDNNDNIKLSRNDLYFYISSLSDLHSKIYFKEYSNGTSAENSYKKANEFMEKTFPKSHYTGELAIKYDPNPPRSINSTIDKKFELDNEIHYEKITYLSNELTNGNISILLEKIANNYETYYILGNNKCLNSTLCGTLFCEYTKSGTGDPEFLKGLNSWRENNELHSPSIGNIEFLQTSKKVIIDFTSNIADDSGIPVSSLDIYQTEILENNNIDDYFFKFELDEVYGGSTGGFAAFSGVTSSGVAGTYICYKNRAGINIACLSWSDHTNIFDFAWGSARHSIESSPIFYNVRLNFVVRRVRPTAKQFSLTIQLGNYTKKYLPEVYKRKNEIYSIEYGVFTTEFRNQQNGCYYCDAKIKASEINLRKTVR